MARINIILDENFIQNTLKNDSINLMNINNIGLIRTCLKRNRDIMV